MFGRLLQVEVFDKSGEASLLVDPTKEDCLKCSGTIEYLPISSGAPRCTIQIYNLPYDLSQKIFAQVKYVKDGSTGESEELYDPRFIRVSFGYRDENNGQLSSIFVGTIAKAFTTRYDATTTITKIYAYQLHDLFTSAFTSLQINPTYEINGESHQTTAFDAINKIFENSTYKNFSIDIPSEVQRDFQQVKVTSPMSFYKSTLDCVQSILTAAHLNYMITTTPGGLLKFVKKYPQGNVDAVPLTNYTQDGKVVAASGLIGIPCLDTDGMRFETLINPNIVLYSYVWLSNSAISDNRDGFPGEVNTEYGATYDPAGLYRVVKMSTKFDSHRGECKTDYLAVSAGISSKYYN